MDITTAKAEVAKRAEDLRIARKHRDEAEDAYIAAASTDPDKLRVLGAKESARRAQSWADLCLDKLCEAREQLRAVEVAA